MVGVYLVLGVLCGARLSEGLAALLRHRLLPHRVIRSQINVTNDNVTKTNAKIMRDGAQRRWRVSVSHVRVWPVEIRCE